jgi:Ca2+/Na+ antiporter
MGYLVIRLNKVGVFEKKLKLKNDYHHSHENESIKFEMKINKNQETNCLFLRLVFLVFSFLFHMQITPRPNIVGYIYMCVCLAYIINVL